MGVSKITNGNLARMKRLGLKFMTKKDASFSMNNVLSMDLETCSVANTEGRFMVYAVGFYHNSIGYQRLVAENEHELCTGSFLWKAINTWKQIAHTDSNKNIWGNIIHLRPQRIDI